MKTYMKVSSSSIEFRIDIDFENCDVDVVYQEVRQSGYSGPVPTLMLKPHTHKVKGSCTPTEESVDFCLQYLMGCTRQISNHKWEYTRHITPLKEFGELKVSVKSIYGLMMGTCHLIFEVDFKLYSTELVNKVQEIVFAVFKKHVRYYKANTSLTA